MDGSAQHSSQKCINILLRDIQDHSSVGKEKKKTYDMTIVIKSSCDPCGGTNCDMLQTHMRDQAV